MVRLRVLEAIGSSINPQISSNKVSKNILDAYHAQNVQKDYLSRPYPI